MRAVYEELSRTLAAIDEQEDLRWWRNAHGPGMPTDWPHFQVGVPYLRTSQSRTRSSPTLSLSLKEWKPEKNKKGKKAAEGKGTIEKR